MTTVYILISGEDWNQLMNTYVKGMEVSVGSNIWIPKVYCVVSLIVGNYTLLALFTGILLQ